MLQTGILAAPASRRAGSVCKLTPRLSARQFHFNIYFVLLPPRHKLLRRPPVAVPVGVPVPPPAATPNLLLCVCRTRPYLRNKDFSFQGCLAVWLVVPPLPFTRTGCRCERVSRAAWSLVGQPCGEGQQAHSLAGGQGSESPTCPGQGPVPGRSLSSGRCHPELVSGNHRGFPAEQTPSNQPWGAGQAAPREPPDREPEPVRVNCGAQALAPAGLPSPGLHVDRGAISQARTPRRR